MSASTIANFRVSFQLGLRDIYRSNVAIITGNLGQLRFLFWGIVVFPIVSAAFHLTAKATGFPVSVAMSGVWGILFLPTILLIFCYVTPYFAAKSLYENNANIKSTIHYSFSDDVVIQEMATGRAELLWSTFIKVRETPDLFLFYVQKHLAHPVPKRAFASEKEIVEFRELIRRHVPDASLRG